MEFRAFRAPSDGGGWSGCWCRRPTSYSVDGLRLWLGTLTATNNAQYVLLCLLFAFKGPAMPLVLAPLAICSAYQVCVRAVGECIARGPWHGATECLCS